METSKQESKLRAVVPLNKPVDFQLRAKDLEPEDARRAGKLITEIVDNLRVAQCATVLYRYLLGKQLVLIQDNKLWEKMINKEADSKPTSFNDWLDNHFPRWSQCGRDTAYNAIQLGRSEALGRASDTALRSMPNLSNAYTITKAERRGKKIDEDVFRDASTMQVAEFQNKMLNDKGPARGSISTTTESASHAFAIAEIVTLIKNADARALDHLSKTIKNGVMPIAGGNPTDAVDFINATLEREVQSTAEADNCAIDVEYTESDGEESEPIEP